MRRREFVALWLSALVHPSLGQDPAGAKKPRTLLAVFAHPDDDVTVGPLLAQYAAKGVHVHLAFATSGEGYVGEHFEGIP
jgi:hypothetical protein